MRLALVTLCLNEMQWLPALYEQHRRWPGLVHWAFVEAADPLYDASMVRDGLSVDGTSEFLQSLQDVDVSYTPYGLMQGDDPAQRKCSARNAYMETLERVKPTHVLVLDADEFYAQKDQEHIVRVMARNNHLAFMFKQRHVWRPESCLDDPLFRREVTGGYWAVPHTRGWRWRSGLRYARNHNWLEDEEGFRTRRQLRTDRFGPQCVHMGFAACMLTRVAKHRYYEVRGEAKTRAKYVACRRAFETWKPGDKLPHGATVIGYKGPVPEVFR